MIFRNLDANGDWTFGKGIASYLTAENAINLNLKTFLKSWTGNCFFSLPSGINWKQLLDKGQKDKLLSALRTGILQQYGVVGVNSVTFFLDPVTRAAVVTYDISTVYSQSLQDQIALASGVA